VAFDPAPPVAGLARLEVRNESGTDAAVIAFALGGVTWSEIEAYVVAANASEPDPSPQAVVPFAFAGAPAAGSASGYETVPADDIGIGCSIGEGGTGLLVPAGPFAAGP
jgi:hypothetical protein